jgi:predicted Zn-dependent protease
MTALILANAAVTWRVQAAWRDDESLYRAMTSGSPGYAVGWIGLADLRARQGARAEAESLLARAESLGPRIPALHLARAALHYRHGEWSAVIEAADRGLALQPALADARLLRAIALTRLRRLDEAAAESARLLAERPDDPAVLALDGQRLLLAGDPAGAVARLEAATRGAPGDVAAWYALGIARALTGAAAGARAAFERTVALDPAYYDGWLQLARACAGLGDAAAARAAAARAGALPEARDGRAAALAAALSGAAPSP